jgi:hypothetical protein
MILTEQQEMDSFLEEGLATGCLRQSKSPLEAPVFFIKKKTELLCPTWKNHYPLPLINDSIHCLKGVCYFTKLNVHWGYNNVCI